jgi:hypothetical protein
MKPGHDSFPRSGRTAAVINRVEKRRQWVYTYRMKLFIGLVLWWFLFLFSWPLAILALVMYPFLWLISIPFRLVGITVHAAFALFKAVIFLPARLLGGRVKV